MKLKNLKVKFVECQNWLPLHNALSCDLQATVVGLTNMLPIHCCLHSSYNTPKHKLNNQMICVTCAPNSWISMCCLVCKTDSQNWINQRGPVNRAQVVFWFNLSTKLWTLCALNKPWWFYSSVTCRCDSSLVFGGRKLTW